MKGCLIKNNLSIVFALFFLSGCCHLQSIGLRANEFNKEGKDYLEVWLPFGMAKADYMNMDLLHFRREIPFTHNTEINAYNALNELFKGPNEQESKKGAVPWVNRETRILDLKIKRGKAKVNFSREFAPAGGTLAIWQCTTAVEEVLRQFSIRDVEIFVEGVPAIESLQP
jgi:hypothetical protein